MECGQDNARRDTDPDGLAGHALMPTGGKAMSKRSEDERKLPRGLYWRGGKIWMAYGVRGRTVRESTGTTSPRKAQTIRDGRVGQVTHGTWIGPEAERVTLAQLLDAVERDYSINGRRSLRTVHIRIRNLREAFPWDRAVDITPARIEAYKLARLKGEDTPAAATVNRELAALKRAFRLGVEQGRVMRVPIIKLLAEHNVRKGFFEEPELRAVLAHTPDDLMIIYEIAYVTGWRITSEILTRHWQHVDFGAGWLRLEPGETKNGEGRMFPLTPTLRAALERQRGRTNAVERELGRVIPWVCHRGGAPIKEFRDAWRRACEKTGLTGRIPHDFRRTAVRNLERAGVSRSDAMAMVGHQTESVYRRYAISDETSLREAAAKLEALHAEQRGASPKVIPLRREG
jgi:integrase